MNARRAIQSQLAREKQKTHLLTKRFRLLRRCQRKLSILKLCIVHCRLLLVRFDGLLQLLNIWMSQRLVLESTTLPTCLHCDRSGRSYLELLELSLKLPLRVCLKLVIA